jgi:TonB-linked SusC/RagA family outer membrane protein
MKKIVHAIVFLAATLSFTTAYGQHTVQGTVTSADGTPLVGATVGVKGTSAGTATDAQGKYSLQLSQAGATLVVSSVGYAEKTVPVEGRKVVNVVLELSTVSLNNVVVIGYGTQKKSDLSSSIASVNIQELQTNAVLPNAAAALEGTTPGLSVSPSSGSPGADINIRVRGSNTFGNNNPLVIIDGAPGDLNNVNPADIASMQVLKDAAAAAIYGSRAANGVLIVTTKKGEAGKVNIDVNASYGVQSPQKFISVANAEQYAILDNALHKTAGLDPFDALSDPSSLGKGSDWQNIIYRSAPLYNAYLGISGGSENATFRVSGAYNDQEGIARSTWYKKALFHFNGQQTTGPVTFGESLSWTDVNQRTFPGGGDKDLTQQIVLAQPIIPVHDTANDGGYGGAPPYLSTQAFNPLGLIEMQDNTNHNNEMNMDVYGSVRFLKRFTYKLNVGYRVWNGYSQNYTPTYYMSTQRQNIRATLGENRQRTRHWLIENTLDYQQQFGKHNIDLLVGYTSEEDYNRSTTGNMTGFPNNSLRVISAGTGYSISAGGNEYQWDMASILGRLLYSYNDKYYLTANVRRDGSSRFGSVNRYGVFPSASAAWRISNEPFFQSLKTTIQNLKLRGSYGVLGNQPNDNYDYIPSITYSTYLGYLFGSEFATGAAIENFANAGIKWESTEDLDVGLDIDLLNSLSVTLDYYVDNTDNVLLNVPIPPSTGTVTAPLVNTGKLQNKGFDASVTYHPQKTGQAFTYSITANFSTIKNEVVALGFADQIIYGSVPHRASTSAVTAAQVGYPIGAFFTKQTDGLFQSTAEVQAWKNDKGDLLQPAAKPGDVRYIDVNKDGIINGSDVAYSGSPFPKFTYGLNFSAQYRHFDFTIFVQGTEGNKMFDTNSWITNRGTLDYNFSTDLLDAWTPDHTNTKVPELSFNDPNHNSDPSDRFLYDASYLRVKTLQLGYTLPKGTLDRLGISDLRIYVSANNMWTITHYPGYDPSYSGDGLMNRGLDQGLYPVAKTVSGGISLHF